MIRIANCSGFYGDRLSAAREMVEGGPIDVLTGDYLAELTMAILHGKRLQDETAGYVGTFLKQLRDVLEPCAERGIKIVSNAGGLNPQGLAQAVESLAQELGLRVRVAWIDGDDLVRRLLELREAGERLANIDTGEELWGAGHRVLTANAYLGAWGIKEALDRGADIVICPRVTDASIVMGPAAWKHGWRRNDYDALAGALAAGHIIECGAQATGGNYAFLHEVPSFNGVGFPIAEIEADGSFTITKHPGTGGLVSVGTVTAQLVYEVRGPCYLNPDVVLHLDSLKLEQSGPDRVRVSGCRGSSPPGTHKVCINLDGGHRNAVEMVLTGLDIEDKARIYRDALFDSLGGREQFDKVTELLLRTDKLDPASNDEAFATLRIVAESRDPQKVGRLFTAKAVELGLASYPGLFGRAASVASGPAIRHWPALVDSGHIVEYVHLGQDVHRVRPTSQLELPPHMPPAQVAVAVPRPAPGAKVRVPLGRLFGARSGDKGGCANVGVWARSDAAWHFLYHFLSVERFRELLPDIGVYSVERHELPNLRALNFFVIGVLGEGVAAATRTDGQAKSLGEYLRAKMIEVPEQLLEAK